MSFQEDYDEYSGECKDSGKHLCDCRNHPLKQYLQPGREKALRVNQGDSGTSYALH